jgi:hypothetical protein
MTVSQLDASLGDNEIYHWIAYEAEHGLRDLRDKAMREESWAQSKLLRQLVFSIAGGMMKWKDKAKALKAFFPEDYQ